MTDDKYSQSRPLEVLNARGLTAKREYVRGLEQRRDPEALSLLVECLCDESWYLRDLAEEAFRRMGPDHAQVLLPLLEEGLWFTRTSAARVLGRIAYRPAVPGLLRLTAESNETVREAAWQALVALGNGGGAMRLSHAIHNLPPDERKPAIEGVAARDRTLADRLARLAKHEELMSLEHPDSYADDSPTVRASEEGVEWEILTGPASRPAPPAPADGGRAPGGER